ncbi:13866_t:CDS:2, partial [Ambispora leptoticha]
RFGTYFYEPLVQFMVGQDTEPRILHENSYKKLPNGHRAHEMPNKAVDLLDAEQFKETLNELENGVQKAFDHFTKWIKPWYHLPLSICRLGSNSGQSFTRSFYHITLKQPWINIPNENKIKFAKELEDDIADSNTNDFGLSKLLLEDNYFRHEFEEFCTSTNPLLHHYPHIYEFVKTKIYTKLDKENLKARIEETRSERNKSKKNFSGIPSQLDNLQAEQLFEHMFSNKIK